MPAPSCDSLYSAAAADGLFRGLVAAAAAARAAADATAAAVAEYCANAGLGADGLADATADVAARAAKVRTEELPALVTELVAPAVRRIVCRAADAAAKARRRAAAPKARQATRAERRRRTFPRLGEVPLAPSAGVLLVGPPPLVARGMAAAAHLLAAAGFRGVRLVTARTPDLAAATPAGVTLGAPWWDSLLTAPRAFQQLLHKVEADPRLGAEVDFILADDLARVPDGVPAAGHDFLPAAAAAYHRLDQSARTRGGVLVAGLPLPADRPYDARLMRRLCDTTRRLDLYEEGGLLYATYGYGDPCHIPEPGPAPDERR